MTGIGVVSPIGIGREPFWDSLLARRSGIRPIEQFDSRELPIHIAGEVLDFDPKEYIRQRKSLKVMCRDIQLGVGAANLAVYDAGLEEHQVDPDRFGVDFGANLMLTRPEEISASVLACLDEQGAFHFERWGDQGMHEMFPLWLLKYLPNMPACHIAIGWDARGPNNTITLGEASGNLAVGEAYRIIARGSADVMIAGATGTRVHPLATVQTCLIEELSRRNGSPAAALRPFDAGRDGTVPGEGAAAFVLESREHAQKRGATIWAEIVGAGSSCSARRDGTPQPTRALVNAMRLTLSDAGATPEEVGHLNAHGDGTRQGDPAEAKAILEVFGPRGEQVPVTAPKSYFGTLDSGSGAVKMAAGVMALKHNLLPPTLNYETPDPACPLNVVAGDPQPVTGSSFLNLSVTRAGQASCVMVRRWEGN